MAERGNFKPPLHNYITLSLFLAGGVNFGQKIAKNDSPRATNSPISWLKLKITKNLDLKLWEIPQGTLIPKNRPFGAFVWAAINFS